MNGPEKEPDSIDQFLKQLPQFRAKEPETQQELRKRPPTQISIEDLQDWLHIREIHVYTIKGVKPRERIPRMLWLRYCNDRPLSYREIGEEYSITAEAVRTLIARGLRMLRHPIRQREWKATGRVTEGSRLWYGLFGP